MKITELFTHFVREKRRWFAYRTRLGALPTPYRTAATGVERYVLHLGPSDAPRWAEMLADLASLFEEAAAANTPIRDLVGEDPVDFADTFMANYGLQTWIDKEQQRLREAVAQGEREQGQP